MRSLFDLLLASKITGRGGSAPVVEPLSITENGTYTAPEGVDGYSPVTVNVASSGGSTAAEQFKRAIERKSENPCTELPAEVTVIGANAFYYGGNAIALARLPDGVTTIGQQAFAKCSRLAITEIPASVTAIGVNAFAACTGLTEITFKGKPNTVSAQAFSGCTNLLTINVPWAEGEVANAPWGATKATINYNYTGG